MRNTPSADVNAQDRDIHVPRLDRLWKPANRCCAIISRHPGVTASRSQATQRSTGAGQAGRGPPMSPCRSSEATRDSIPLTMPVPGLRRGRGVSERPATSSTDSTPAIDVHPNVQVEPFAPSYGLQPRQSCCDWSPARINQAKCWSGRHYVGTAGYAPPDQDIPARRISSAWRPTYTPSYMLWYLYTDIPQAPPPSPKSSRIPSIETANKSLAGPPSPPSDLQVPLASSHDKQRKLASHHRRVAAAPDPEQVFFAGLPCPSRSAPDRLPSIISPGSHFQMSWAFSGRLTASVSVTRS